MARQSTSGHVAEGLAAFSSAVQVLMRLRKIESHAKLAEAVRGIDRKTVNNALSGRHNPKISTLQAIADALDCPLWVMLLVGKSESDLESPRRERLIAMVQDYLKCDNADRQHIENMASAFAAKAAK